MLPLVGRSQIAAPSDLLDVGPEDQNGFAVDGRLLQTACHHADLVGGRPVIEDDLPVRRVHLRAEERRLGVERSHVVAALELGRLGAGHPDAVIRRPHLDGEAFGGLHRDGHLGGKRRSCE